MSDRKPGVYLCKGCGIGEAVDVGELEKLPASEFKIGTCKTHDALCSDEGVALIKADIDGGDINQAIIGACSHRVMTDKFSFNGTPVIRANLREQVAWSQPAGEEDTQMLAADQVRMAMAQASKTDAPSSSAVQELVQTVMIVGGGVTGLSAALEAAKAGHKALLVERSDKLGGWANKWSKRMPHLPPYRGVEENNVGKLIAQVEAHGDITVMTDTMITKTSGAPGKFEVTMAHGGSDKIEMIGAIVVATGWRPYDASKLTHLGYGASPDIVTGVELEDMLGDGKLMRKSDGQKEAKYIAFIQCAGSRDPDHLPYCSSVCCGVSIKQSLQIKKENPDASCYVIYDELRTPGTAEEFYREAQEAGVIFMKGKVKSVGGDMSVVYEDDLLGQEVPLNGLDMIVLATGMVPNSTNPDTEAAEEEMNKFLISDINPAAGVSVAGYTGDTPDPVKRPEESIPPGGSILNLQYRQGPHIPILADGFSDSHYICFPYETRRTGIYTCGPVRRPMDMAESADDAAGAVLKAIQAIRSAGEGASVHPRTGDLSFPKIGHDICTKCRRCAVECPFGAIDEEEDGKPIINESRCRRCGTCMGACPVRTISFDNYSPSMVGDMIKAIDVPDEFEEKPRIIIFACENDAYPALDMAGINRQQWSAYVRVIPVRCLGSVTMLWVSTALESGFDGIMLMGCKSGDDYQCHFIKGSGIAKERMSKVGATLKSMALEEERVQMEEVSIADSHSVAKVINKFAATIGDMDPNPFKGF